MTRTRLGRCPRIRERDFARELPNTKPNGIFYMKVSKDNHEAVKDGGPPFSLQQEELMVTDAHFDHVEALGEVYQLNFRGVKQTGRV
jgi:hypothetical protein